jgi:hypothetical protein
MTLVVMDAKQPLEKSTDLPGGQREVEGRILAFAVGAGFRATGCACAHAPRIGTRARPQPGRESSSCVMNLKARKLGMSRTHRRPLASPSAMWRAQRT